MTVDLDAGAAATANAGTDVLSAPGQTLANDAQVTVTASALPGGLAVRTTYYVVSSTGSTFKLALTRGGPAIDVTSAGFDLRVALQQPVQALFANLTSSGSGQRLLAGAAPSRQHRAADR